jgi:hypothetical protein
MRRAPGPGTRRPLAVLLAGLVTAPAALLSACSVPREADLTTSDSPAAAVSSAAPAPSSPSPVVEAGASGAPAALSASASPSTSPSPSPPAPRVPPPTPVAVAGYTLNSAASSVGDPLADVKGASAVFGALTTRSVSKGGTPIGLLFLFAVRPQYSTTRRSPPSSCPG